MTETIKAIALSSIIILFWASSTGCGWGQPEPQAPQPPAVESEPAQGPSPVEPAGAVAAAMAVDDRGVALPDAGSSQRAAARHLLVAWVGAKRAPMGVQRGQAAARRIAEEALERARSGEELADLARELSDCPTGRRGGFLGGFSRGAMDPTFEEATFELSPGELSDVVETPFGYHVILREPLEEIRAAQVMVQWEGVPRSPATRQKREAEAIIEEAKAALEAGRPFDDVVASYSDGPMAERGGDLGWFTRGQFLPDFEEQVFALDPGEVSGVFETRAGLHLVKRLE